MFVLARLCSHMQFYIVAYWGQRGNAKVNGREPWSCLGRVFNFKLGHFASKQHKCIAHMQQLLELKTRPRFFPVNWSLSMGKLISYEENEVLWIRFLGSIFWRNFGVNLLILFCKLGRFMAMAKIIVQEGSGQAYKSWVDILQKSFIGLAQGSIS